MDFYTAYHLNIQSEIPFPDLLPGRGNPDVIIRCGRIEAPWNEARKGEHFFQSIPGGLLMTWAGAVRFLLSDNQIVTVEAAPGTEEASIRNMILGPILGVMLYRLGYHVFHASVIALPQGGVAFLAPKGHGKSSLAASLVQRGHRLVSDDLLVYQDDAQIRAEPGIPVIKLWPDALRAIGVDPARCPRISPEVEKRVLNLQNRIVQQPVIIRALFVIQAGQKIEVLPLVPREAIARVMPNWYGMLFQGDLLPFFNLKRHLQESSQLVNALPVYLLRGPISLDNLDEACRVIECHTPASA
jgi:hypothetical protein